MLARTFECPSCGAPLTQRTPGAKVIGCTYCGQTSMINAESLLAVGEKQLLIDYGSAFAVGKSGQFDGRDFMVMGRMRMDYSDGFWDEWYIQFMDDGSEAWIQEDDGSFVMFKEDDELSHSASLEMTPVGQSITLGNNVEMFVTSKEKATVNGGEGELPFLIKKGDPADFIEGIAVGRQEIISAEILPGETHVFIGYPFLLRDISLSN